LPTVASVLVCEPVQETRFLIERVVARMGHQVVGADAGHVDVVVYEHGSRVGRAQARSAQRLWPGVLFVACCSAPPRPSISGPRPVALLMHPFTPADVRRVLTTTCASRRHAATR
jgi:hypothetical protein